MMIRKQDGFTLVELMITMLIFILVIVAAGNIFSGLLNQFKQQSRIAESNIEGIVGLELLRTDLEQAGFGNPWDMGGVAYTEVPLGSDGENYNDAPGGEPRPILIGNNVVATVNAADELVIKATNVATSDVSQRFSYVINQGTTWLVQKWNTPAEDLVDRDYVIVTRPVLGTRNRLLVNGGAFYTQFDDTPVSFPPTYRPPQNSYDTYLVYGIKPFDGNIPIMPFNRADYFISNTTGAVPSRCAGVDPVTRVSPWTGVLVKSVIQNSTAAGSGQRGAGLPILDCVADLQVVLSMDNDEDGAVDGYTDDLTGLSAENIRNRVKEIRVYVLAHEGQRDLNFTFNNFTGACATCLRVGEFGMGRDLDISVIPNYLNYRWKVYTLAATPRNLR
ncbi:MAG: prepilin-type N-terminal cleavage/methylation domain-containing protein [Nitrospirae bacterium]|nr:prepilin-type N-terminal cleavage/methylation domain-containing protein [Nitrospirota bacterium]